TRSKRDWSSDVCSSDLPEKAQNCKNACLTEDQILIYCHNNDTDMIESTEDFNHTPNVSEAPEASPKDSLARMKALVSLLPTPQQRSQSQQDDFKPLHCQSRKTRRT